MFGLVPAALFFSLSPVTGPGQRAQSEGSWGSGQSRWRFSWLPLIPDDDIKVQGPQSGLPHPLGGFSTIFHLYHSMHYLLLRGLSSNGFFQCLALSTPQEIDNKIFINKIFLLRISSSKDIKILTLRCGNHFHFLLQHWLSDWYWVELKNYIIYMCKYLNKFFFVEFWFNNFNMVCYSRIWYMCLFRFVYSTC